MDTIEIAGLDPSSITDGPGIRFTIFAQGCNHNCEGCHNPQTHKIGGGTKITIDELVSKLTALPMIKGVTFSGGEPFEQANAFAALAKILKEKGYEICAYSGYTFQHLLQDEQNDKYKLLTYLDVLVDQPFMLSQRTLSKGFKGSLNQNIIDVQASLLAKEMILNTTERWNP